MITVTNTYVDLKTQSTQVNQVINANLTIAADLMKWLYLIVCICGLICNFFVMLVIGKSRKLQQQPRNWLIFCRSASDFLGAIFLTTVAFRLPNIQFEVISNVFAVYCISYIH